MFVTTNMPAAGGAGVAAFFCGSTALQPIPSRCAIISAPRIGVQETVRRAKAFGLKARAYHSSWRRLIKRPGPGIAVLRDGGYLMFGKANEA